MDGCHGRDRTLHYKSDRTLHYKSDRALHHERSHKLKALNEGIEREFVEYLARSFLG
jgi:hypothetical protein